MKGKIFQILTACLVSVSLFTSCDEDYNFVDHFSDEEQVNEGVMKLEGKEGDVDDYNMVYVDLSEFSQFKVPRTSWDLGFYSGDDGFHVTLNSSHKVVAAPTEKNDFAAVTLEDARKAIDLNDIAMSSVTSVVIDGSDDLTGDLNKTIFAPHFGKCGRQ